MIRRPPRSTRTDTLFPYTTLFRSDGFSAGQRISKVGKRLFDILASLIVLIVGLPLIIIAGVAVMLDSRGPVFYRQPRVGLFGEPYDIFKIRSMRADAEAAGKAVRTEERRVGKECVRTCRSRGSTYH